MQYSDADVFSKASENRYEIVSVVQFKTVLEKMFFLFSKMVVLVQRINSALMTQHFACEQCSLQTKKAENGRKPQTFSL